ncbi:hypothetical protein GIB67_020574 [Kingdonia uniflora]|uniref:ENT domain-containing protein n=1 Tax=Kingdonia uniflora TaxID=39325 RepID=A0A7J7NLY3_9MAGN|nr:hypothetical protein GIB67_020574 [Kingdonia uniflora]
MIIKKGDKVEVLSKKEVPLGYWCCAEIISGNGHTYKVRFDCSPGATDTGVTERVPRKVIRPCPPPVEVSDDWVPGDVVEVFENECWKVGAISKVIGRNRFFVRLLGSSYELRVHKSYLRMRQSWQDDGWILTGKGSGNREDCQLIGLETKTKLPVGDCYNPLQSDDDLQESYIVSSRTLKRGSPYEFSCASRKMRAIAKEKVDAVPYPKNMLGGKYLYYTHNSCKTGFSEKQNKDMIYPKTCFVPGSLEPNDTVSTPSSVGSCSSTNTSTFRWPPQFTTNLAQDSEDNSSDAESSCARGYEGEQNIQNEEELVRDTHKLELHTYRCTLEALYASGSLSWEQETTLSNLRLKLHISNDEHLIELRRLVSSKMNLSLR